MSTSSKNWDLIKEIFDAALQQPVADRPAFVQKACGRNNQLEETINKLLLADQQAGNFLEQGAVTQCASSFSEGTPHSFSEGDIVSNRFEILRFLGEGGMGEVYEVRDLDLGENLALKTIRPDFASEQTALGRFKREIQLARRVTHPNVCRVFDLGRHVATTNGRKCEITLLTMELLKGETLADRLKRCGALSTDAALPLVRGMAAGLAAAHEAGIIHRDLKPSNVIIVPRARSEKSNQDSAERTVVTDFGLARSADRAFHTISSLSSEADAGRLVGTLAYMAPEQLDGGQISDATDIYAFGLVMYEMVTGTRPFQGTSAISEAMRRLSTEPPPPRRFVPALDSVWESVILRCLEREASKRFATALEVLKALEGNAPYRRKNRPRTISTLAVLPFTVAGEQPDTEYFADGITESVINLLSQLPKLRVLARASVFRYKKSQADSLTIARELGVDAVLTGRIETRDQNIIVAAELVKVSDGSLIWGRRYVKLPDPNIEQQIAKELSRAVRPRLQNKQREQLFRLRTDNTEAYHLYLRGRFYWNQRSQSGLQKGIRYFQDAISKDTRYALAYSGLSDCFQMLGGYRILPPEKAFSQSREAATKALAIDKRLAEAHTSLALTTLYFDWDWKTAEREFKAAIRLGPRYPTAHQWYTHFLMAMGRRAEALRSIKRAHELDPLSLPINTHLGWAFYFLRRFDDAVDQLRKTIELDASYVLAHFVLGLCHTQLSQFSDAISELEVAASLSGRLPSIISALGYTRGLNGDRSQSKTLLEELRGLPAERYVSPYDIALLYLGLGEEGYALDWLELALKQRVSWMIWVKAEPMLDTLRPNNRFQKIVEAVDLP
jgi:serine/threonine protein kinase